MGIGARDGDFAGLQRLAQGIEHRALEFGQLVEEQHAEVRQADFAGAHFQPAAGQRRHRGGVVRAAERAGAADAAFHQRARDRCHHRDFERFGRCQFGQDPGQAAGEQRFASAWRSDHQQVVAPGSGNFEGALGGFLAFDLREVGALGGRLGLARFGNAQHRGALEVIEQADQVRRGEDRDATRPARFGALRCRADQALVDTGGVDRGEQHAGGGDHPAIQRQLAHRDEIGQLFGIGHAHRGEQGQRDRQVVMRAFLGQVCRRKVDGDALGRKRQAHCRERGDHPFAAFVHRLVRQADDIEARQPRRELALHLDAARLKPEIGDSRNQRDHSDPPNFPMGVMPWRLAPVEGASRENVFRAKTAKGAMRLCSAAQPIL